MSKRNPIKSMTGNMWAALRRIRNSPGERAEWMGQTENALKARRLLGSFGHLTDFGRVACDAFTEGQESVR